MIFSPALMIKKLRYYARFIVVSLLLNNLPLVRKLVEELGYYVEEYTKNFKANDAGEWQLVMEEISKFIDVVSVL